MTPRQFLGVELQGQPRGGSVATKMENCSDTVLHPFSISTSPCGRGVKVGVTVSAYLRTNPVAH